MFSLHPKTKSRCFQRILEKLGFRDGLVWMVGQSVEISCNNTPFIYIKLGEEGSLGRVSPSLRCRIPCMNMCLNMCLIQLALPSSQTKKNQRKKNSRKRQENPDRAKNQSDCRIRCRARLEKIKKVIFLLFSSRRKPVLRVSTELQKHS